MMQSSAPLVSIIIPVYNDQNYLKHCLDQLLAQTLQEIEVICINDGSTDQSGVILQEYAQKDARVKVIEQENAGAAVARNQGLNVAVGMYLMFCDSDDYYELDMCESMVRMIQSNEVDVVICDSSTVKDDGEYYRSDEDYHQLRLFGYYEMNDLNRSRVNAVVWNKIFLKSIIDKYNLRFPEGIKMEDASFIFKYISVATTLFGLNKKLYNRRMRVGSVMDGVYKGAGRFDGLRQEDKRDFLSQHKLWASNSTFFVWSVYDALINTMKHFDKDDQQKCLELVHEVILPMDFDALNLTEDTWGLKELKEIKECNFSRYIPKRKSKFFIKKEKFAHLSNTYLFGIKVFSKKQDRYIKEVRLFGCKIYKKNNVELRLLDEMKKLNQQMVKSRK